MAHRVAYELAIGPIPDGLLVCHRCDNPPCCNPTHLFLGTYRDNVLDCIAKNRRARTNGEAHGMRKLTEQDVRGIRARRAGHDSLKLIASDYGVTIQNVCHIVNRKTWTHI